MRKVELDLRYSPQDVDAVLRAHEHWDRHLREQRCGGLEYLVADREASVWRQAADGFHQIGTTRMSRAPADGVVGPDCNVHGFDDLFVASSSVFVTSGQANSTFLIVAFALRLADHLKDRVLARPAQALVGSNGCRHSPP
jgi:choline dehydrogenase-like flavoprotein